MLVVGASVLVGAHSVFDFSLQMPVIAGAPLWRDLPANTRDVLLDGTRRLIDTSDFRRSLRALLATGGDPVLVTRVLAGHPDELRALNRSMARERMDLHRATLHVLNCAECIRWAGRIPNMPRNGPPV